MIVQEHGSLENLLLEEIPDPVPGSGEVLVNNVHAASVNFPDLLPQRRSTAIRQRYVLRCTGPSLADS